ncbi:MAG: TauD/TfdA family dioxygenase [Alphaproteobacteria bacterium]|nr:TauD/TfdA family dioxygenase [Alphaproteobacteria bacterium]
MSPSVGAEIHGIDLSQPLKDEQFQDIRAALGLFGVIFLRDQDISPADQLRFAKSFGDININRFFHPVEGYPEIANVQRQPDERGATGWYWHTDHSYDQVPAMGSVFAAREIPPVGGDTLFAGMTAAYDALSEGLKQVLEGLEAWHADTVCPEVADPRIGAEFNDRLPGLETAGVRAKHPVVIRHPISGRKVLYVNSGFTEGIDGWNRAESKALLDYLFDHATQPQFTYRHRWREGDVAFWDNRATWHCALDDCFGYKRVLHRITIEGEPLRAARAD